MTQLSPNFTLEEFLESDTATQQGIDNTPNLDVVVQLTLLTNNTLEAIRNLCGDFPMRILSGYRCPQLNAAVGGADNSAHLYGCAADIVIPEFGNPREICLSLEGYMSELQIDQLILEMDQWVHVGRVGFGEVPRNECLTINNRGTFSGFTA